MARNFDDLLQRDMKCHTFLRSFCVWSLSCMFLYYTIKVMRRLIAIGRFGIRKINQTQFYQNFGWLGVYAVGVGDLVLSMSGGNVLNLQLISSIGM